jgi:hypothetical protein
LTRDDQIKNLNVTEESSLKKFQETQKMNTGMSKEAKYLNLGTNCIDEEFRKYTLLFQEFKYVFSWTYDDLKEYDKYIFQHTIPLREGAKPFKQKIRLINPKPDPLVKIKLENLKRWV